MKRYNHTFMVSLGTIKMYCKFESKDQNWMQIDDEFVSKIRWALFEILEESSQKHFFIFYNGTLVKTNVEHIKMIRLSLAFILYSSQMTWLTYLIITIVTNSKLHKKALLGNLCIISILHVIVALSGFNIINQYFGWFWTRLC